MITRRSAASRIHLKRGLAHVWNGVPRGGFGELLMLEDEILPPEARVFTRTVAETVLYLCNGSVTLDPDSSDEEAPLLAGAFQRLAGAALQSRSNASKYDWARVFRIKLRPSGVDVEPEADRVWFSAAERRGRLRLVASSETDDNALWIPQDVLIYSALLDPGQHVVCELEEDRCAWIHMVRGSASVLGETLEMSDSAEVREVRSVGITARDSCEVLVLDVNC